MADAAVDVEIHVETIVLVDAEQVVVISVKVIVEMDVRADVLVVKDVAAVV